MYSKFMTGVGTLLRPCIHKTCKNPQTVAPVTRHLPNTQESLTCTIYTFLNGAFNLNHESPSSCFRMSYQLSIVLICTDSALMLDFCVILGNYPAPLCHVLQVCNDYNIIPSLAGGC